MIALTHDEIFLLTLSVEQSIHDTARKQRAATKRRDEKLLAQLTETGDRLSAVKIKLIQMRG